MRFNFIVLVPLLAAASTEDLRAQMCSYVGECSDSKFGSYCKLWLSNPVCFGLAKKSDGSVCFQPTDSDCRGEAIACGTVSTPIVTTTDAGSTSTTTEAVPSTTTTEAVPSTTTTEAVPSTTTTEAVPSTHTTEAVPSTNTTEAVPSTTTTEAVPSTYTTEAVPSTNTTEVVPSTSTTEAVPSTSTTAQAGSTSSITTETGSPTNTTTEATTSTTVATTAAAKTSTTTSSASGGFGGNYCGELYGQSFIVDFDESGRATVSMLGQKAGADYEAEGDDIIFSNYDPALQKLMDSLHIKSIKGTIFSPTEIHIKAGLLIDTTLTSC